MAAAPGPKVPTDRTALRLAWGRARGAAHAAGTTPAPAQLAAGDRDDLDAGLAKLGVGIDVALVGDDHTRRYGEHVVAVVPLFALGLPAVATRRQDTKLADPSAAVSGVNSRGWRPRVVNTRGASPRVARAVTLAAIRASGLSERRGAGGTRTGGAGPSSAVVTALTSRQRHGTGPAVPDGGAEPVDLVDEAARAQP
jgi:hypothetical protein